jgi:hypothetical protein
MIVTVKCQRCGRVMARAEIEPPAVLEVVLAKTCECLEQAVAVVAMLRERNAVLGQQVQQACYSDGGVSPTRIVNSPS